MKSIVYTVLLTGILAWTSAADDLPIPNQHIDYEGFLRDAAVVGQLRLQRRITEQEFLRRMDDFGTIVFDARSDQKFHLLHIKGAVHLSLPDVTAAELAKVIPSKTTTILIYCNNNFEHAEVPFAGKTAKASLNIYTFNTLYSYGYRNVYELGPSIDINTSILPFEGVSPPH
jgi:rhodanese-like protein